MVAVERLDVDSGFRHAPADRTELAGPVLFQPLDQHFSILDHLDAGLGQRASRRSGVGDQEMGDPPPIHRECAAALQADAGRAERLPRRRERARPVLEPERNVAQGPVHGRTASRCRRWCRSWPASVRMIQSIDISPYWG